MSQIKEVFLFEPTQIPGCQLWLDAADVNGNGTSVANGAAVSTWVDKSGNGRNATAGANATFSNSGLYFNGTSYLDTTYTALPTIESIFIVYNLSSSPGYYTNLIGPSASGGRAISLSDAAPYFLTWDRWGSAVFGAGASVSGITFNTRTLTTGLYNGTGSISLNGSNQSSGSAGSFSGSGTVTRIGRGPLTAGGIIGFLFEVIIFNTFVSTSQRQQIEGYLAWKWGLQGLLPSSHPFKTYRPLRTGPVPTSIPPMPITNQNTGIFLPTQISNCSLWLDAADTTTISSSGGSISQWRDKSSNALVLSQATSANQPTLGPLLNNLQTIQFTTTQSLVSTSNLLTNPAQTWFTIFNAYNNTNTNRFFINHSSNISITGGEYFFGGNGTIWANIKSGNLSLQRAIIDNVGLGVSPFNSGQWYNTNIVDSNSTTDINSYSFRIDGTSRAISILAPNSNILTGTANINLFINNLASANVYLSEIIFYNTALSIAQVQQVEGYLAWKWGLVGSLPSNHPYKQPQIFPLPYRFLYPPTPIVYSVSTWLPTKLSGCQLWLDGADSSSVQLVSGLVSQWTDKSGSGNNATQSVSGNRPTYVNNGLTFSGSQWLITSITSAPSVESFFIVLNTTNNSTVDIFAGTAIGFREVIIYLTNIYVGKFGTAPSGLNGGVITTNTRLQFNYQFTTSLLTFSVNGSVTGSGTPPFTYSGSGTSYIGSSTFAPNNFVGSINEIIYYPSSLTSQQRQQVEGYLAWKWGLVSSLPANHPFKLWPPSP
jgi:hypothetical protein